MGQRRIAWHLATTCAEATCHVRLSTLGKPPRHQLWLSTALSAVALQYDLGAVEQIANHYCIAMSVLICSKFNVANVKKSVIPRHRIVNGFY